MPNLLDILMDDGAPVLTEGFGERDERGSPTTVTLQLPGNAGEIELEGCRVQGVRQLMLEDDTGHVRKRETTTIHIPRKANELEIRLLQKSRFIISKFGIRVWVPQPEGAVATDTYLTYQLEREPLAHLDDKRESLNS